MSIETKFNIVKGDFILNAELELPSPGVTGLLGPSGSGKTTYLRAVAGLDRHSGGYLRINGTVWQDDSVFLPPHKRPVGYVFQDAALFPHLNVRKNLEFGVKRSSAGRSLDESVDLLGIERLLDRNPESLSGGEKQRVAIARSLAVGPELLLMDEPLASLDMASRNEILPYLEAVIAEIEIPTIYVSHNLEEIARLSDHLVLLDEGEVKAAGAVKEILTRLDLPLSHGGDAEALVDAVVEEHDDEFALTVLKFEGGNFTVPRNGLPPGTSVRLRVFARDVSLTLKRQSGTSIQNIFPATVDQLKSESDSQMIVKLRIQDRFILSRITRKSAVELGLKKGKKVFAQVKSVVLLS